MAIPLKIYMHPSNDQIVYADGLYYVDPADSTRAKHYFDNTAVVTATLYDQYDNPVPGCIGIALPYVSGTSGNFAGLVEETFAPAVGTGYYLVVTADQGAAHRQIHITVEVISQG